MPLTADVAEKLGFVNHIVEGGEETLKKAREIAEAIIKNEQGMVLRIKSVINDGLKWKRSKRASNHDPCKFPSQEHHFISKCQFSLRSRTKLRKFGRERRSSRRPKVTILIWKDRYLSHASRRSGMKPFGSTIGLETYFLPRHFRLATKQVPMEDLECLMARETAKALTWLAKKRPS
ncbi:unnamed protein product [Microthlaspi erraticum]|uniref:Uncharacterized protein n=1 Tax=Microthlaspi erraticum TaxID=1685480 RepID=A0A6D2IIQ3_9BRAS|nr:unnamed protein product [Microthlaspi erraticum]